MTKRKGNENSLLAAIQRQTPSTVIEPQETSVISEPRQLAKKKAQDIHHQPLRVSFYIHEEDRRTIRELSAWLASQGMRPSDSLIIRAALRLAKTGSDLLGMYSQLAQLDRRYKQTEER